MVQILVPRGWDRGRYSSGGLGAQVECSTTVRVLVARSCDIQCDLLASSGGPCARQHTAEHILMDSRQRHPHAMPTDESPVSVPPSIRMRCRPCSAPATHGATIVKANHEACRPARDQECQSEERWAHSHPPGHSACAHASRCRLPSLLEATEALCSK